MNVPKIGANFDIDGYQTVKCTGDPMKDAKNFADANNITIDEAKAILSGKFGDPAKKAADAVKTGTAAVDDDAELDADADLDVDKTGETEDFFEIDEVDELEEDEEVDDEDDTNNAITDAVKAAIDDHISDVNDKIQEAKNTMNAWAKRDNWGYGDGVAIKKYNNALKDLQASISDFLDYVDTVDMSSLDYSTRRLIDDVKDDTRTWSDKLEKATKTAWYSDSTLWSKGSSARKKTINFAEDLVSKLQSAGLASTALVKNPGKPTT